MLTCEMCGVSNETVKRVRQNTLYPDDNMNHVILCPECKIANDYNWEEQRREYFSEQINNIRPLTRWEIFDLNAKIEQESRAYNLKNGLTKTLENAND